MPFGMHWVKAMEFEYVELALRIRSGRCEISVAANCGFTPVGYLVNQGCFVIISLSPKEGFSNPSQIPRVKLGQTLHKVGHREAVPRILILMRFLQYLLSLSMGSLSQPYTFNP
jgi:hypothetical protein